jgi:hypothetical protein
MSSAAAAAMAQGAPKPIPREQLMSLPSLSNSLYSLPNATAMSNIAVHTNFTTTVQHNAEGHAKVRRILLLPIAVAHNLHSYKKRCR